MLCVCGHDDASMTTVTQSPRAAGVVCEVVNFNECIVDFCHGVKILGFLAVWKHIRL